ncbi:hypothetical protein OROGR_001821 [Orobanche gracilis]
MGINLIWVQRRKHRTCWPDVSPVVLGRSVRVLVELDKIHPAGCGYIKLIMNFMPDRPAGFYEEVTASRSSSSSTSSSFHHRALLPPYTYGGAAPLPPPPPLMESGVGGEEETPDDSTDDPNMLFRRCAGGGGSSTAVPAAAIQREHMFDKVVTPSDVGKLNRLVIPKQHAEKYFPLDSSTNEKGLLLNFEDRNGKPWRFRYSYWNSSQSYVMTKGWSRFVKEKKLDAGDIVSFQRGVGDLGKDRLFIDWRRRPDASPTDLPRALSIPGHHFSFNRPPSQSVINPWAPPPLFIQQQQSPPSRADQLLYSNFLQANNPTATATAHHHHNHQYQSNYYHHHYHQQHHPYAAYGSIVNGNPCPPGSIMYLRSTLGGGPGGRGGVLAPGAPQMQNRAPISDEIFDHHHHQHHEQQMVFESVPVVQGKAAAKRLRLFGVNMDCPIPDSDHDNQNNNLNNNNINHGEFDILMPHRNQYPSMARPERSPYNLASDYFSSTSSSSFSSLARLRSNHDIDDKGKGSMSLDLDI